MLKLGGRRKRAVMTVAVAAIAVATGLTAPSDAAPLTGSTFEATDGNLAPGSGTDWGTYSVPPIARKHDASIKVKQVDDFYQGGPKHDDPCPTVKHASAGLPASKDDLTEFYVLNETAGSDNDNFLYLAWERFLDKESTSSAHMGFEFNQLRTSATCNNDVNVDRSPGDVLILFDLEGGGGPQLRLMRWLTTGSANLCEAKSSLPCWGDMKNLTADGDAEGAVNSAPPAITDPISGATLNFSRQFGEAAINLTKADIFPPGTCQHFGNAILASRSSGNSFNSGLDDFAGPLDVDIQNCGSIRITKTDDASPANPLANVVFSAYKDVEPFGEFDPDIETVVAGSCTTGSDGVCTIANLFQGNYWIVEDTTTVPPGHDTIDPVLRTVAAGSTVEVPLVNPRTHKMIVLVCHEGDNTLVASQVVAGTLPGTDQKPTLGSVPVPLQNKITEQELCGLGGAVYGGLDHGSKTVTATISSH